VAKSPIEIRSLARSHTASAIETLSRIMRKANAPAAARVAAAQALLDRGWGKAVQPTENRNVNVNLDSISDAELLGLYREATGAGDLQAEDHPAQLN
jgi:formiminotetrahydrofolate cyclodeaminase